MKISKLLKLSCLSIIACSSLQAYTLKSTIKTVLDTNPEVIAEKRNQDAFKKYIDEREANYLPRLDIDARVEQSNSDKDYYSWVNREDDSEQEHGYYVGFALNQMLYDGKLTDSRVKEAKFNDLANDYRTNINIENVISETIKAYTGLVQYNELLALTEQMIKTNEKNLEIAKEKEIISGEVLETYQVESKLNFVKEKYLEELDFKQSRVDTFKRYVGFEPDGKECRPILDESVLPKDLEKAVKKVVLENYEILEQIERIKAQREKIAQSDSTFLPTLNLELKVSTDKDLALNEEGYENQAFARLNFAWNLYNGGGDQAITDQETMFLAEQKKRLDSITKKVVESVKVTYQRFHKNKERIDVLKKYVVANENIVDVYKNEFQAGTRTFVDILNAQTDLYEANKSLVNREYELYSNYYELLNLFSTLTNTVLKTEADVCVEKKIVVKEEDDDLSLNVSEELSALLGDEEDSKPSDEEQELQENLFDENSNEELEDNDSEVKITNENIKRLLESSPSTYTLNLATRSGLEDANSYVLDQGIDSAQAFTYEFGPNMKSAKVIYGIFNSVKEAQTALKALPDSVKAGKPYIDNVSKHQNLYKKYH